MRAEMRDEKCAEMYAKAGTIAAVIGEQSLKLLKEAAKFVPVPGIGVAAAVALEILQIAMVADENKDNFETIGKHACEIMVTVIQRVNRSATGSAPPIQLEDLQRDADMLQAEMKKIEKIVEKHSKRKFFARMVFSAEETGVIQQCQDRLDHVLKLFGLQSDIELRQQVALLHDKIDKMSEKLGQAPQMPQPFVQPNPSSQSLPMTLLEQPAPPYLPSPQPSTVSQPPSPQPGRSREERKVARHARKRIAQHTNSLPGAPPDSTFNNLQNHLSPSGSISYSYVHGNTTTNSRDDSFNVSGTGNTISISFTR